LLQFPLRQSLFDTPQESTSLQRHTGDSRKTLKPVPPFTLFEEEEQRQQVG
jgi:hypothetical protein